jgi:hypothetical protein
MFVREGILDPLSTALLAILDDDKEEPYEPTSRAVQVLLLFCQAAQADHRVREAFATRMIMTRESAFLQRRRKLTRQAFSKRARSCLVDCS